MVVRKAKLVFAALVAEDWKVLVSQMSYNLDEIDTKMSDNIISARKRFGMEAATLLLARESRGVCHMLGREQAASSTPDGRQTQNQQFDVDSPYVRYQRCRYLSETYSFQY